MDRFQEMIMDCRRAGFDLGDEYDRIVEAASEKVTKQGIEKASEA